ncbi:MAG: FAD-dependent oxidoreductase [Promethearchaeota archaeon]
MENIDVVIIGGGPAGLAAALAAHDEGVSVAIIERDHELGGILQIMGSVFDISKKN